MMNRSNLKLALTSGVVGFVGMVVALSTTSAQGEDGLGPDTIFLTGIVRDFRERTDPEGHTDFEIRPDLGFAQYVGNVAPYLSEDGKPIFIGQGRKLTEQWMDSEGRNICNCLPPMPGDAPGTVTAMSYGGIESADSFHQWFRDVPGVNLSRQLTLAFKRQESGSYVFDDKEDPVYSELGGFFPIEDQLFGNPGGSPDRNFHFTFELSARFTYDASADQTFKFIGDDDVWVFVNGQLVIDIGGVHGAREQFIQLSRLGLEDGETYPLQFFFAERHRTQSNFRIETNIDLETVNVPAVTAAFD